MLTFCNATPRCRVYVVSPVSKQTSRVEQSVSVIIYSHVHILTPVNLCAYSKKACKKKRQPNANTILCIRQTINDDVLAQTLYSPIKMVITIQLCKDQMFLNFSFLKNLIICQSGWFVDFSWPSLVKYISPNNR